MTSKQALLDVPKKNTLARNTGWMFFGQGLRFAIQALYFALIARALGVAGYGAFVGVVALVGILFPFGSLGSGFLIIKNVARDPRQFPKYWGTALMITAAASSALLCATLLLARFVLPHTIPMKLVLLVAASDLFGNGITALCCQAFQAFELLNWTAAINVMLSSCRLIGAFLLIVFRPAPSALLWGQFYLGGTAVAAVIALALVLRKLGPPAFNFERTAAEAREGFYFSTSLSAQTIYNDIDKTMLARLSTLDATGIYGAAYRLIDVSFAPVSSLLAAAYPNFFRTGANGIAATLRYARPLIVHALGYASIVSFVLLAGAGIVPLVLGTQYQLTQEALRWLAILPVLKVLHFFLSDALTGAGYAGLRSAIQVGVALFNVSINFWLIPAYSWRGAAWSSIASDALLAFAIGVAVLVLSRSERALVKTEAFEMRAEA
jgi:O-antigen/teichoic acid export membrane protein